MLELLADPVIVSAAIALVGATGAFIVSYLVASRSYYIGQITASRAKWIETLRENIANLLATIDTIRFEIEKIKAENITSFADVSDSGAAAIRDAAKFAALIKLQLNPQNLIDSNVIKLLEMIDQDLGFDNYTEIEKQIVNNSQWLLKAEWEKVKFESRSWLYRAWHRHYAKQILCRYQSWLELNPLPKL